MRSDRRRRGFQPLGAIAADRLGLPSTRGRELLLASAWRHAAGEAIAQRTRLLHVRRGVLELAFDDEHWTATVSELIPRLAGRLAAAHPELGVRRFRLLGPARDAGRMASPLPVEPLVTDDPDQKR